MSPELKPSHMLHGYVLVNCPSKHCIRTSVCLLVVISSLLFDRCW
ncbi:hypothetical protein PHET_11971 [Paragonimus heterotremus]|uniref:Uncharacterized protein n=1 Tax=Paragonimus heterotremus TaxID=100268 RepID=A0A8J4WM17_9TREM|nr:hypothetical protein PHET_11971 [Paragonimus heterotremus]